MINCNEKHICGKIVCCGYCDEYEHCKNKCSFEEGPEICGYGQIISTYR